VTTSPDSREVDISPERCANVYANLMAVPVPPSRVNTMVEGAETIQALRTALTAVEKDIDEAVSLLRAVGAGGIFSLMAESSDDADVWYDQRDQFLEGK
jgi:hypothetical protein